MGDAADDMMFRELGSGNDLFNMQNKQSKVLPCKKCGSIPVKIIINTGFAGVSASGKSYSADRLETSYACMNVNCGVKDDKAIQEWNEKNK